MDSVIFNEQTLDRVFKLLETATAFGGAAAIIYFLIPVVIALIQYGWIVFCVKYIVEGVKSVVEKGLQRPVDNTVKIDLGRKVINAETSRLYDEVLRIRNSRQHGYSAEHSFRFDSDYIHDSDVDWLREAINDKIQKDKDQSTNNKG